MNNNSEDVVKNVESNNVESTSNKQRQTNKPIVISRRRLLRAGVAGIPVVLTMTGIAPAAGIQTTPSAASAMWYGGNKVYNRFAGDDDIVRDGLVWTDHNGFVLKSAGGVYSDDLTINTDSTSTGVWENKISLTGYNGDTPSDTAKEFTVSVSTPSNLRVYAYLHKTGEWYTDLIVRAATSSDLLDYIKDLELTVKDGSNTVTSTKTPQESTFTSSGEWYQTKVLGYSLVEGSESSPQDYYLLPASDTVIDSVNFNAKVSFTYETGGFTYTCTDQSITIPLKLIVSGIPDQVDPGTI